MTPATNCAAFELRGSPGFARLVEALHVLAAGVVVAGPFPIWSLALLPAVGASLFLHWRAQRKTATLRYENGRWYLSDGSGSPRPLRWLSGTRTGPRLTVLHARSAAGRHFWAIAGDVMPAEQFRRLRMLVEISRCD